MTITKEQLDELERVARSMPQPERWNIYVKAAALARLVAIARAALAWNERNCDPVGCNGWWHTLSCQGRHSEADRALRAALRGAP